MTVIICVINNTINIISFYINTVETVEGITIDLAFIYLKLIN